MKVKHDKMSTPEIVWLNQWKYVLPDYKFITDMGIGILDEAPAYEGEHLVIPGGRYTPDFIHRAYNKTGKMLNIYIECKPDVRYARGKNAGKRVYSIPGYRDSRVRLNAAASIYREHVFIAAFWSSRTQTWELEYIKPDGIMWTINANSNQP
mgnify:CR=1 FL=1